MAPELALREGTVPLAGSDGTPTLRGRRTCYDRCVPLPSVQAAQSPARFNKDK
jgi:hypothetical protein